MAFNPEFLFCIVDWRDRRIFAYRTGDALGTILGTGYFTAAADYMLSLGDSVLIYDGTGAMTAEVAVVAIEANGAATVEDVGSNATDLNAIVFQRGDIIYYNGTALARLPIGNEGDVLGAGADDPAWRTAESVAAESVAAVESVAALAAVTGSPDRIWVDSYYAAADGKGNAGGGMLFKDQADTTSAADGATIFNIGTARYKRGSMGYLKASEKGLYNDQNADQAAALQDYFDVCLDNNFRAEMDVDVSCNGAEIYINTPVVGLDRWNGINFQGFTIVGANRRYTRILQTMLSIGSANTAYNPGSGAKNLMRTSASNNLEMKWIHLEGALNLYNIEGSLSLDRTNVFASREMFTGEGGCQTYVQLKAAHDARWAAGPGRATVGGWQNTHIVEMLYCNHPRMDTCNIRNGYFYVVNLDIGDFPDKDTYTLKAMQVSQCGNLLMTSGGVARNYGGIEYKKHPVYGGSGAKSFRIYGTHFEANRRSNLVLERITEADIRAHFRGSPASNPFAWDTDYPQIVIDTGTAREINIHSHIVGAASDVGIAIQSVRCEGLTIGGEIRRFKTVADLSSVTRNYRFDRISYSEIGQGTEFVIHASATPWQLDKSLPANVTPININKRVVNLHDDFLGTSLDANWTLNKGSDGDTADFAIVANSTYGEIAGSTGSTTNSMAGSGVQITTGKNFRPDQGAISMETKVKASSIAGMVMFIGLVDATGILGMPFTYSGTTLAGDTTTFDNAVGFLHDSDGTDPDYFRLVGMDTDALSSVSSDVAPNSSYRTFRIDIDATGKAAFYIDNVFVGDLGDKITDPYFDDDPGDWTYGSGWARVDPSSDDDEDETGAYAQHTAGSTADISIPITVSASVAYTLTFSVSSMSAGTLTPKLTGGTTVTGTAITESNAYSEQLTVHSGGNTALSFTPTSDFNGRLDSVSLRWTGLIDATAATALLTPYIGAYRHSAAAKTITADYITVEQKR